MCVCVFLMSLCLNFCMWCYSFAIFFYQLYSFNWSICSVFVGLGCGSVQCVVQKIVPQLGAQGARYKLCITSLSGYKLQDKPQLLNIIIMEKLTSQLMTVVPLASITARRWITKDSVECTQIVVNKIRNGREVE